MSGDRLIEMIIQIVLCEQAPTDSLYNYFCMAELLQKLEKNVKFLLTNVKYGDILNFVVEQD